MTTEMQSGRINRVQPMKGVQTMKGKMIVLGIVLLVGALLVSACGAASRALEPAPAGDSSRPSDPIAARDAVLAYLAENYRGEAPARDLAWAETHTKPEGLVGGESYEYTAGDWVIAVSYPVVAPDSVVYTLVVRNGATGFQWEGQVDANGHVVEAVPGR